MNSLRRGEFAALASQAAKQPAVLRALLGRLWADEQPLRVGAARTLAALAVQEPDKATELVRRLLWALNDESGTNGAAVVPALEAMAGTAPHVVGPFAGALVAHLDDDGLRADLLRVLAVLQEMAPSWLAPHAADIARWEGSLGERLPAGGEEVGG